MGPGSYEVQECLEKLKKGGKGIAKLYPSVVFANEAYFEVVNNMKVLQTRYLKGEPLKSVQRQIKSHRRGHPLPEKLPNESLMYQRAVL